MNRCNARFSIDRQGAAILSFEGARLATLNQLLGMDGRDLRHYNLAWFSAVERAVIEHRPFSCFEQARVHVTRVGRRPIDPDNFVAKPVIDGLRHAGLLRDDDPTHLVSYTTDQCRGDYAVMISVDTA